jgi:nucleoside-diphosphate-sugar epimerase
MKALVIGGTGPTGPFLVKGLRRRGFETTILHTGNHEVPEIPEEVEHVHTNPYDPECLRTALQGRRFDLCVASYGRLRATAELTAGRVGRFLSVGGLPSYRGYMNPELFEPPGLPVPTSEDAPRVTREAEDSKGFRVARSEEAVFAHHPDATHFRYPYVYGPYQPAPREWCIVRRILDRRPCIVLPDGGLTLHHFGYAENLAHAVLLAIDQPEASAGRIYNCGDREVLTLRQVVEVIATGLGHSWEIVSMPWELATPARPLVTQPFTTHRVMSLGRLVHELGYRDAVPPREALVRTARWLVEHRPSPGGMEEWVLQDPFDYRAEDALVAAWKRALQALPELEWEREPGYGMAYSGPGGRGRSREAFE